MDVAPGLGVGAEAVLDASGRVTALREGRGGTIPPDGSVLSGTGEGADWLRAHAQPGDTVRVSESVSGDGATLEGGMGIVNGGPRLVSNGRERSPRSLKASLTRRTRSSTTASASAATRVPSPASHSAVTCSSSPLTGGAPATVSAPASRRARPSWTPSARKRPSTSMVAAPRA
jgi:hypothetical protein